MRSGVPTTRQTAPQEHRREPPNEAAPATGEDTDNSLPPARRSCCRSPAEVLAPPETRLPQPAAVGDQEETHSEAGTRRQSR